jgi:hypothetical protein
MDLNSIYEEINTHSFQGELPQVPVKWSQRMVRAAGIFYEPVIGRRQACIKLSRPLLLERELPFPVQVAGLSCENREIVIRRVLEHEMLHVYFWLKQIPNGHNEEFRLQALDRFGHTEIRHTLRYGSNDTSIDQLTIGARVRFNFREQLLRGVILRIHRNATVLAEDDRKFYVPLSLLRCEQES